MPTDYRGTKYMSFMMRYVIFRIKYHTYTVVDFVEVTLFAFPFSKSGIGLVAKRKVTWLQEV